MAGPSKRSRDSTKSEGASKKVKTTNATSKSSVERKQNSENNSYWELSVKRRVTVESFKGQTLVAIREFYEKDGKTLPGKSGISLTPEQFWALAKAIPGIKDELKSHGETEFVVSDGEGEEEDGGDAKTATTPEEEEEED